MTANHHAHALVVIVNQKFTVAAHGSTSGVPSSLVIRLFSDLRGAG